METTEYRIPAVALRGMVVLPEMVTHFDVSRSRSIKAVEQALSQKQNLFVVTQQDPDIDAPEQEDLFTYGTVVEIKQIVKMPHNILRVLVEGMFRARLVELETGEYLNAQVEESEPEDFGDLPLVGKEAMLRNLKEIFQTYCEGASRNALIVSIDTEGRNLFEENKVVFNERKEKAIEEICKHVSFIK